MDLIIIMTSHIKHKDKNISYSIVRKEWDLDKQIKIIKKWIPKNNKKLKGGPWILDIGYSDEERPNAVVCGYTVDLEFMKYLVKYNIILWLSSYGRKFDEKVKELNKST